MDGRTLLQNSIQPKPNKYRSTITEQTLIFQLSWWMCVLWRRLPALNVYWDSSSPQVSNEIRINVLTWRGWESIGSFYVFFNYLIAHIILCLYKNQMKLNMEYCCYILARASHVSLACLESVQTHLCAVIFNDFKPHTPILKTQRCTYLNNILLFQ